MFINDVHLIKIKVHQHFKIIMKKFNRNELKVPKETPRYY